VRKITVNTGWLIADRIVRLGIGAVVSVLVARYFGPERFGIINFALAFSALFAFLTSLGLDNIIIKELVTSPEKTERTLGTGLVLRGLGSMLAFIAAPLAMYVIGERDQLTLSLAAIFASCALFRSLDIFDLHFQAKVLSKYTVWTACASFLVVAIAKLVLVQRQAGLMAFAWMDLMGVALASTGLAIFYFKTVGGAHLWRFDKGYAYHLLAEGWPLMLSSLAIMIYMRIDQIMLQRMLGPDAVGLYSAAIRLSELWYFIPMAITSSIFPSILKTRELSLDLYYFRLKRLFSLMSFCAVAIAIPMTVLSRPLVVFLFGSRFAEAGPILAVHIWAALFVFWGVAQAPWNITEGLQRLALYRTVAGAVINVVLNLVLIPRYAGMGAAIATVIAYGTSAWLANLLDRRTRPIFFLQTRSVLFLKHLWET
jgi:PST family polysaccharide transporter